MEGDQKLQKNFDFFNKYEFGLDFKSLTELEISFNGSSFDINIPLTNESTIQEIESMSQLFSLRKRKPNSKKSEPESSCTKRSKASKSEPEPKPEVQDWGTEIGGSVSSHSDQ